MRATRKTLKVCTNMYSEPMIQSINPIQAGMITGKESVNCYRARYFRPNQNSSKTELLKGLQMRLFRLPNN
jgi:hypothetical protein